MQPARWEARGLCKQYGKQTVLDHVDLAVEPGCIYGLIGRNGAGKTTLLSILTGQNTKKQRRGDLRAANRYGRTRARFRTCALPAN